MEGEASLIQRKAPNLRLNLSRESSQYECLCSMAFHTEFSMKSRPALAGSILSTGSSDCNGTKKGKKREAEPTVADNPKQRLQCAVAKGDNNMKRVA
jgi:hypothetical protein